MRRLFALGLVVLTPIPATALAEEAARDDEISAELTQRLRDPVVQDQMAGVLVALSQAMLDLDLSPMAEAMGEVSGQPAADLEDKRTLRELAPEAEQLPETIERELPPAMNRMADMGSAIAMMLPALRQMAEEMGRAVEESTDSAR